MLGAGSASASPTSPDVIYSTTNNGAGFATVDPSTGAGTVLGSTGFSNGYTAAMDTDGTLWTIVNGFTSAQIAKVNKLTGQATPVGAPIGTSMLALDIAGDGTMYGIGYSDERLYRIDKTTGVGTPIGSGTGIPLAMDLAFDCEGRLWATAMGDLWTVDVATGTAVSQPSITGVTSPGGSSQVMGLMFDRSCRMLATTYTDPGDLYAIDPDTGAASLIGSTGLNMPHGGTAGMVVDTQAPTTTDNVPATAQASPVTVTLTAADSGSGVDRTYYTTGASPAAPTTASAVYDPAHKPVLANGEKIRYFSVDRAGNVEADRTSRAVVIRSPQAPTTGTPTSPTGSTSSTTPAGPATVPCGKPIVLTGVAMRGHVVELRGITRSEFAGQPVTITARGRVVAHTTAAANGTFQTTAAQPKTTATLRYQAWVHGEGSVALAASRMLIIDSQKSAAGGLRVRGHLLGRHLAGRTLAVDRILGCSGSATRRIAAVHTRRGGRFTATLAAPDASEQVAYYRLRTVSGWETFTLPIVARAR